MYLSQRVFPSLRALLPALALVPLVVLSGCPDDPAEDTSTSPTPTAMPYQAPDLALSVTSLDFGTQPFGEEATRAVEIQNKGNAPLKVEASLPEAAGGAFALVENPGLTEVSPSDSLTLTLSFTPAEAQSYTGLLRLSTNDEDSAVVDIPLEGVGAPPDGDGDGYSVPEDCDDADETVNPGVAETCDGIDNDCDDEIDEGLTHTYYTDEDGDGAGDATKPEEGCEPGLGLVDNAGDCDDSNGSIHPLATEVCDEVDNNCNGEADEAGAWGESTFYLDEDLDGYGSSSALEACSAPDGYVSLTGDCNDTDARFHPGAEESDCSDQNDYNCDGSVSFADADGDGFPACQDCNDANATAHPGGEELCDTLDNDCDGNIDEGVSTPFYMDADVDGYGNSEIILEACTLPEGYAVAAGDCNDGDAFINPAGIEWCDQVDNDCDGEVDEASASDATGWYIDSDQDGYGSGEPAFACSAPDGYVAEGTDCDDSDPAFHPGADEPDCTDPNDYNCDGQVAYADTDADGFLACEECDDNNPSAFPGALEVCDEADNNCDGSTDEGVTETFFADNDGDGWGDSSLSKQACSQPAGYVANDQDCNDSDVTAFPLAPEYCDGRDNDCDGTTDEPEAVDAVAYYPDGDNDGYGVEGQTVVACDAPVGYAATLGDCNDADPRYHPGAEESSCSDPNDYNCDGSTAYKDGDGDGVPACQDCDDTRAEVKPGGTEVCDGLDNDCDGSQDEGVLLTFHVDADGDGYGGSASTLACTVPPGYVADASDCNDQSAQVNPAATEACNGKDDDCDAAVDETNADGCINTYVDGDGDTFGGGDAICQCTLPLGYVTRGGDCNDSSSQVFPGATEKCNTADDDCDGEVNEANAQGCTKLYADRDSDTWGLTGDTQCLCEATAPYSASVGGDCNDNDGSMYPNNTEVCDEKDNNCNGTKDEGVTSTFYIDSDADGYGATYNAVQACKAPTGYVAKGGDCNDFNAQISPSSKEACDKVDNDCDGFIDEDLTKVSVYIDLDGDGHGASGTSGTKTCLLDENGDGVGETAPTGYALMADDCNDSDVLVYTGAAETCDGKDNDCDTIVDKLCFSKCDGTWPFRLTNTGGIVSTVPVDLNGDGQFESVVQDNFGFAILDTNGTALYNYSAPSYNYSRNLPVLADVDSYDQYSADTQSLEILTGNGSFPRYYKLNADKTVKVFENTSVGLYDASRFMVSDMNADGVVEFFSTTWCEGSAGTRIWRFDRSTGTISKVKDIPDPDNTCEYTDGRTLTDLDADGLQELVFGNGYGYATAPSVWGGNIYAMKFTDTTSLAVAYYCDPAGDCFTTDQTGLYNGWVSELHRLPDRIGSTVGYFYTNVNNQQNGSMGLYWAFDLKGAKVTGAPWTSDPGLYPTDVNDDGTSESVSAVAYQGLFDVNGDGYPDLLGQSGTELRVYLWNNTSKAFVEHTPSRLSISSVAVRAGNAWDMDGDGRLNLMASDSNGSVYCYELGPSTWNKASSLPPHFPWYMRTYQWDNYEPNEGADTNNDGVPDKVIRVASAMTRKANFYSYLTTSSDRDYYLVDANWGGQICMQAPRARTYRLKVFSYRDLWDNVTKAPTPDGKADGLIWQGDASNTGQTCFYGSSVTPYRYGEYRFVVGVESVNGSSPYWPYWLNIPK